MPRKKKFTAPATEQDRGKRDTYLVETGKCGRRTRRWKASVRPAKLPYCTNAAGAGTDHPGDGACWQHGGRVPRGVDSPAFGVKHQDGEEVPAKSPGKYSVIRAALPENWRAAYDEAKSDPRRFTFDRNVQVLSGALVDSLERAAEADPGKIIDGVREQMRAARAASESGDLDGLLLAVTRIETLVSDKEAVPKWSKAVDQVIDVLKEIRYTVRDENKRQHEERLVVTQEQLALISMRWIAILEQRLLAPDVIAALGEKEARKLLLGIAQDCDAEQKSRAWGPRLVEASA